MVNALYGALRGGAKYYPDDPPPPVAPPVVASPAPKTKAVDHDDFGKRLAEIEAAIRKAGGQ